MDNLPSANNRAVEEGGRERGTKKSGKSNEQWKWNTDKEERLLKWEKCDGLRKWLIIDPEV